MRRYYCAAGLRGTILCCLVLFCVVLLRFEGECASDLPRCTTPYQGQIVQHPPASAGHPLLRTGGELLFVMVCAVTTRVTHPYPSQGGEFLNCEAFSMVFKERMACCFKKAI